MQVTVTAKKIQTGSFSGTTGETLEVPENIGAIWIAIGCAVEADPPGKTPPPAPPIQKTPRRRKANPKPNQF